MCFIENIITEICLNLYNISLKSTFFSFLRYEKLRTTASKVSTFLASALERRYQLAMQDFQRWLITNVEKTSSCNPDFAGDRYSIESKMGVLQVSSYFYVYVFSNLSNILQSCKMC